MELKDILENGEVIVDSNNSLFYERMGRLENWNANEDEILAANCHGMVAHLLAIEDQVSSYWQRMLKIPEVRKRTVSRWDVIDCSENGNPGYVGPLPMTLFLNQSREAIEIKKRDAVGKIIAFDLEVAGSDGFRYLRHTGIYLGEYCGTDFMFHKEDCEGIPQIYSVLDYMCESYSMKVFQRYVNGSNGVPVRYFDVGSVKAN